MATTIKLRRNQNNTFDKTASTVVLERGEPFVDLKTTRMYVGDGTTQLKNLKAISGTTDEDICTVYKATHAYASGVHTFTLGAVLEGNLEILPVLSYTNANFTSGDYITLVYKTSETGADITVTGIQLYMTNGNLAVSDSFKNGTVNQFIFYINNSVKKAFISPAVSVWSA